MLTVRSSTNPTDESEREETAGQDHPSAQRAKVEYRLPVDVHRQQGKSNSLPRLTLLSHEVYKVGWLVSPDSWSFGRRPEILEVVADDPAGL